MVSEIVNQCIERGTCRAAYCWGHVATAESRHAGIECSFLFWRHAHLINRVASTRRGEVSIESHLKLFGGHEMIYSGVMARALRVVDRVSACVCFVVI